MSPKQELVKELATNELKQLLNSELQHSFKKQDFQKTLGLVRKKDGTLVTRIDELVHHFFLQKKENSSLFKKYHFLSEELKESHKDFTYPCLVLDPIDGTKELAAGIGECAVSLAILESPSLFNENSQAWLFNPFTGFEFSSYDKSVECSYPPKKYLSGLVSRTEFSKGLYSQNLRGQEISLTPRGSIAFKLGLLASGACDFVMTKRPKNLWDIAAGGVLCQQRGIRLYGIDGTIQDWSELDEQKALLWCRPEYLDQLTCLFHI